MIYKRMKRIFDFLFSLSAMIILLPVLLLIAAAIKIDSRGPVLFKQVRVGRNKKQFVIYKFRTMSLDTPKDMPTHLLTGPDQYITRVGKILRKCSLDELPQIWNILIGHMSVIGPRPALWNQYDLIAERDKYGVNDVRPGLTGWAQINGRDTLSIEEKSRLDGDYIDSLGFIMDVKCFVGTILTVIKQQGVVEGDTGVMRMDDTAVTNDKFSI